MLEIWNNWILVALFAPFLWAVVNVIDVYFVESVYRDEYDGAIISGAFQILPWLFVALGIIDFRLPSLEAVGLALGGGAAFLFSFLFYFRALFSANDAPVVQTLWNLSIPLVPFLAWVIAGEKLSLAHYAAVMMAFSGAMLLTLEERGTFKKVKKVVPSMLAAVFLLSLSMVLEESAYEKVPGDFWSVFLLFSIGAALAGLALVFWRARSAKERLLHIARLGFRYFLVFLFAEGLALFGILFSQRAIALSPAVSFVAMIESLVPVFVILMSLVLAVFFSLFDRKKARKLYRDQITGLPVKIAAAFVIAFSIYLIT